MLLTLTMLPLPLAAIPGAIARDEEERRADVAGEHPVKRVDVELRRRPEDGHPGVVDKDVDIADLAGEAPDVCGVAEVGGHEARLTASGGDRLDGLGATRRVTAMDENLGPVSGQVEGHRAANARRCPSDQRPLPLEVVLLRGGHGCS